jgi:hypothetical protein
MRRVIVPCAALAAASLFVHPAYALDDDFEFNLEGYYRTRGYIFPNLYDDQAHVGRYMEQRLRIQPELNFEDRAKFIAMADVLDDVVWGDNESMASTSLFAGDPSNTDVTGHDTATFQLKRAWLEFKIPVGLFRVGRQASQWGMGLLANDGNGFDDTFGENHDGATYDRVIFATRPIAITQTILGKDDTNVPLFLAVGVDRLVEDPLYNYYGYECDPAVTDDDERCTADEDHGYVDDTRTDDDRSNTWWVDSDDDVMEMIYVAVYRGEDVDLFGKPGDLTAGLYVVNRVQDETQSNVLITDAYLKFLRAGLYLEGEVLHIGGDTDAIALAGAYDPFSELPNPLHKTADIWGYVGRAGYVKDLYSIIFETGYASGDDNVADEDFTGRPLHADYNVGLILYDEVLARVTATTWTEAGEGLWSKGGVYNSRYVFPNVHWRPLDNWEIIGAWLMAWPDKPDGSNILCADGDAVECADYAATASNLGWEADLALKHRFHNHVLFSLETGYAQLTDRLPLENVGLNSNGKFFTLQSRIAYEF